MKERLLGMLIFVSVPQYRIVVQPSLSLCCGVRPLHNFSWHVLSHTDGSHYLGVEA
jgi:hypothetical protein